MGYRPGNLCWGCRVTVDDRPWLRHLLRLCVQKCRFRILYRTLLPFASLEGQCQRQGCRRSLIGDLISCLLVCLLLPDPLKTKGLNHVEYLMKFLEKRPSLDQLRQSHLMLGEGLLYRCLSSSRVVLLPLVLAAICCRCC